MPDGSRAVSISGTELRRRLARGEEIPAWFTFPSVAAELSRRRKGASVAAELRRRRKGASAPDLSCFIPPMGYFVHPQIGSFVLGEKGRKSHSRFGDHQAMPRGKFVEGRTGAHLLPAPGAKRWPGRGRPQQSHHVPVGDAGRSFSSCRQALPARRGVGRGGLGGAQSPEDAVDGVHGPQRSLFPWGWPPRGGGPSSAGCARNPKPKQPGYSRTYPGPVASLAFPACGRVDL